MYTDTDLLDEEAMVKAPFVDLTVAASKIILKMTGL
jgi:hypothetical protein